jgi:electron transfer flavoprotein beta subunit
VPEPKHVNTEVIEASDSKAAADNLMGRLYSTDLPHKLGWA